MARLTIEDMWWTDPRRSALISALGGEMAADWAAVRSWRLAQDFWKHERKLIPKALFDLIPGSLELVRVGLADVRESFVYVRGSSAYLDWVTEKRAQAKEAGKKSAEARRAKAGNAQPKRRTDAERASNEARTESNDAEPSVSGSSSVSVSGSSSGSGSNSKTQSSAFDLEAAYRTYPLKKGKSGGLKKLAKDVQTQADYDALLGAIARYSQTEEVRRGYIKHFSTFASEWRDWTDPEAGTSLFAQKTDADAKIDHNRDQYDRVMRGEL